MLYIVTSHHRMQLQGKRIIQTQENVEKPHFGPASGTLVPNWGRQSFFQNFDFVSYYISLSAIIMYNIIKKLMIQS